MKIKKLLFVLTMLGLFGFSSPLTWLFSGSTNSANFGSSTWVTKEIRLLKTQASNINENVLRLSLTAYLNALKHGYVNKPMLTVIDYSKPSTEKRLWVFDLKHNRTLFNTWVTHGKNSGGNNEIKEANRADFNCFNLIIIPVFLSVRTTRRLLPKNSFSNVCLGRNDPGEVA